MTTGCKKKELDEPRSTPVTSSRSRLEQITETLRSEISEPRQIFDNVLMTGRKEPRRTDFPGDSIKSLRSREFRLRFGSGIRRVVRIAESINKSAGKLSADFTETVM